MYPWSFLLGHSIKELFRDLLIILTTGQKFDNLPPDNKIEALEVGY